MGLTVHVLTVGVVDLTLLQRCKIEEVRRPMNLVIKLFRVRQLQFVFHIGVMTNTWNKQIVIKKGLNLSPQKGLICLSKCVYTKSVITVLTHKIVVPGHLIGHHEEAKEAIRQQHLHPFIVRWQITLRVVALICVLPAPLVSARSQLISSQCT